MTKEQEKAIEICKNINAGMIYFANDKECEEFSKAIETVLSMLKEKDNLINEQLKENVRLQKELNEENKRCMILANNDKFKEQVIDLMAEYIATLDIEEDICKNIKKDNCDKMNFGECEHCIKQYFERKSEEC